MMMVTIPPVMPMDEGMPTTGKHGRGELPENISIAREGDNLFNPKEPLN
jgi:hypothetical protein